MGNRESTINIQDIEKRNIYLDNNELRSVLMGLINHDLSGYLSLILSPVICFVINETLNYFKSKNIKQDSIKILDEYHNVIKKSRALLKIFDDNEGGKGLLQETFALYNEKSALFMNVGKKGCLGYLGSLLQPEIGIYFFNNNPVYMTQVGFSAMGYSRDEVESLEEKDFDSISKRAQAFGYAIGEYFSEIELCMVLLGISNGQIIVKNINSNIKITYLDFKSHILFKKISSQAKLVKVEFAPILFFIFIQVNIAYTLLPQLFNQDSNLLFRIQFLTAYHAISSLQEIQAEIRPELSSIVTFGKKLIDIPNIVQIRNVLSHYSLGKGKKYVIEGSDALEDIIKGFSGFSRNELNDICLEQLKNINNWSEEYFSKNILKNKRSIFGG